MEEKKEHKPYEHCGVCEYKGNKCKVWDRNQRKKQVRWWPGYVYQNRR